MSDSDSESESINDLTFDARRATQPQLQAAAALADKLGRSVDDWNGRSMGELLALAQDAYGADLPDFWRIWLDWHENAHRQAMGDL